AGRSPLGDADVVDPRLLAPELLEEALDHLGRFGDAFTAVRDARLTNPLLQVLDVIVDVLIDVGEDLLEIFVGDLAHVRRDFGVAGRTDPELLLRWSGRGVRRHLRARAARCEQREQKHHGGAETRSGSTTETPRDREPSCVALCLCVSVVDSSFICLCASVTGFLRASVALWRMHGRPPLIRESLSHFSNAWLGLVTSCT